MFLKHVPTVERALQRSIKMELLDGENLYMCPRFVFKQVLLSVNVRFLIACTRTWISDLLTQDTYSYVGGQSLL